MVRHNPNIKAKIKRILLNARRAWWVLLIIVAYTVIASFLLGTGCLLASVTGLPCPGCGITRSFVFLMQGDIVQSFTYHPLLIPTILLAAFYSAVWLTHEHTPQYMEKVLVGYTFVLIGTYAVRMFFLFPNELPLVYNNAAIWPRIFSLLT